MYRFAAGGTGQQCHLRIFERIYSSARFTIQDATIGRRLRDPLPP